MLSSLKTKNRLPLAGALGTACLLMFTSASLALTATGNFTAQITIATSCTVNSASKLDFGSQGLLNANVDQTSTIQVQCTNTTPYNIALDAGLGTGATIANRLMTSGGNVVNYTLYRDSARSLVWGNTPLTDTVSGAGTGATQSYTVYGRVPSQTTPAPGTYNDTITITVNY